MKISNIEDVRNEVIDSLERLRNKEIDVIEAAIIAKSSETIMSSLKMQLMYAGMLKEKPNIKFLQDCHQSQPADFIEHEEGEQTLGVEWQTMNSQTR